ncbi:hypothetical protein M8J77_018943 [Diaphorina citri]|nr:hypothetical protein M8J77_018943 [Diaphorina citri]
MIIFIKPFTPIVSRSSRLPFQRHVEHLKKLGPSHYRSKYFRFLLSHFDLPEDYMEQNWDDKLKFFQAEGGNVLNEYVKEQNQLNDTEGGEMDDIIAEMMRAVRNSTRAPSGGDHEQMTVHSGGMNEQMTTHSGGMNEQMTTPSGGMNEQMTVLSGGMNKQMTVHSGRMNEQMIAHSGGMNEQMTVHSGGMNEQMTVPSGRMNEQMTAHSGEMNQQMTRSKFFF